MNCVGKSCCNCSKRFPGCHDSCRLYLTAKKMYELEKEGIRKQKSLIGDLRPYKTVSLTALCCIVLKLYFVGKKITSAAVGSVVNDGTVIRFYSVSTILLL